MIRKFMIAGLLVLTAVFSLTGCAEKLPQGAYADEILTTVPVDQDKTMITVRVEFGISQTAELEQVLEAQFPNVDIVLCHDGSTSSLHTIRADLEEGTECDLILSRRLPTVGDIAEDYLLDLSTEDFVDNYYLKAVDSCTNAEGKVYFLPGPSDFYGIVYDKTLFEQNGWQVPHSYSEFVQLVSTIRDAGLRVELTNEAGETEEVALTPLQPSLMYPDMFQILFNTYGYEDTIGGTDNFSWLMEYQNGSGTMVGHMEPAVEKFSRLFEDGILSLSDWEVTPHKRSTMLYAEHTTAMIIECQNAVSYAQTFAQNTDNTVEAHEIAMMPFWTSDEEDSDYLYVIPSYYMAINKQAAQESKHKKELLLDIYAYISSSEGQQALLSGGIQMSNIKGASMENSAFDAEVLNTIEKGRLINTFYYAAGEDNKQVERQMLQTAPDMLKGDLSVEEWLREADQVRDDYLEGKKESETVYGQVKETMTKLESAYTVAEMYKEMTQASIGICLGGTYRNGTNGHFYEGDITDDLLACITPNKEPQKELENPMEEKIVVASLTGAQIIDILNTQENETESSGQYPYYVAAGLSVRFNPWADEGERVISVQITDGTELDMEESYEVAYYYGSLPDDSIVPERALEQTWQESFLSWLQQKDGELDKPEMTLELVYDVK